VCPVAALLQSIVASYPQIASFPESHFLTHLLYPWNHFPLRRTEVDDRLPRWAFLVHHYAKALNGAWQLGQYSQGAKAERLLVKQLLKDASSARKPLFQGNT
jgi:hypothetical protein